MKNMEYIIKDAEHRHIGALKRIEDVCFSVPWTEEMLEAELPDESHVLIIAESGGEAIGYVGMQFVLDEGYVSNVAVAPEYRRMGVGRALIAELLKKAEALRLSFVTLEVRRSNAPAIALYSFFGFVPVGERRNYYQLPREDAVLMTKYLKRGVI